MRKWGRIKHWFQFTSVLLFSLILFSYNNCSNNNFQFSNLESEAPVEDLKNLDITPPADRVLNEETFALGARSKILLSSSPKVDSLTSSSVSTGTVINRIQNEAITVSKKHSERITREIIKPVDIVIGLDFSSFGSTGGGCSCGCSPEVRNQIQSEVDKFLAAMDKNNIDLRLKIVTTDSNTKAIRSQCYRYNKDITGFEKEQQKTNLQAFINANLGTVNPSPTYWGLQTYKEDKESCFRGNSDRYLIAIRDGDEMTPLTSILLSSVISETTRDAYINELRANKIQVHSIASDSAVRLKEISKGTQGVFSLFTQSFSETINILTQKIVDQTKIYNFSDESIYPSSLLLQLEDGTTLVENLDFILIDQKSIQIKDEAIITNKVQPASKLKFSFYLNKDVTLQTNEVADPIVVDSSGSTCSGVLFESKMVFDLYRCFHPGDVLTYKLTYLQNPISLSLPKPPTEVKITYKPSNLVQILIPGVYSFSSGQLGFQYNNNGIIYHENDLFEASYIADHQIFDSMWVSLNLPLSINHVYYKTEDVLNAGSCVIVDLAYGKIQLFDCRHNMGQSDFQLDIHYRSAADVSYSTHVQNCISTTAQVFQLNHVGERDQLIPTEMYQLENHKLNFVSDSRFLDLPMELSCILANTEFSLSKKPEVNIDVLQVQIQDQILVPETDFVVNRTNIPYVIQIRSKVLEKYKEGDKVLIKYSSSE